jgi:thiamine biosynthesis lipoprotein
MVRFKILVINVLILVICFSCSKIKPKMHFLEGNVFGTDFHIVYEDLATKDYSEQIDSLFHLMNKSLSTYQSTSDISKINRGDSTIVVDSYFKEVFEKSTRIYIETNGVFDPTIGVLVNAWGFGPNSEVENLEDEKISLLLNFVGFDKVQLIENMVFKKYPEIYLDFNAIAKGYGVDVVSRFLESKEVKNYMIEIGGELRCRGVNRKGDLWKIGIEKPIEIGERSLQQVVLLDNESMATSGNYRKFKVNPVTGEKYVHTIDTKSGYTVKRDILSASVISSIDCADLDGYATAFMAMGFLETKEFLKKHPELKVFLIYLDDKGKTENYSNFRLTQ